MSYANNQQSIHSSQSSSTKTTITNQPSTTHFIKYENVIYKLTLSTDGKQRRWIYVTPLHNHRNETKGNDVSGHTGNKRTVMKVSNATIPITLSTVHHTNNLYENFNHNNHKVNNIKNDDDDGNDIQNGNVARAFLNTRQNVANDSNRKLDFEKLSHIELKKATIHKNFKQSNNGITNESNDEYRNIDEYQGNQGKEKPFMASLQNDENGRSYYHRRHGFNPFDKNLFANDGVVNKNRLPPLIKNDFVKNVPNGNDLSTTHQRYAIPTATTTTTTQSSALIPSFHHHLKQSNKFAQNDYYRLIEGRHRKYILRSNPFRSVDNEATGKYGFWDGQNKSFDPVRLQLMLTHHESILPQPHFWGIRGYGLYSFAAGNDLHNNLPNGAYKVERDFDN